MFPTNNSENNTLQFSKIFLVHYKVEKYWKGKLRSFPGNYLIAGQSRKHEVKL